MIPRGLRLVAVVSGHVQGVGFRWFVQREAASRAVAGWVTNKADGSVEVVAEGPEAMLQQLLLQLWEGPPGAAVRDVQVRYEPPRGNVFSFTIRSGAHPGD